MQKIKYQSINGLRAISILLVIIHHLVINNGLFKDISDIKWLQPFTLFLQDGHLGVTVFFVISGFLITSLMQQEELSTKTISLKSFYIRRTLRIFPAYFFLLLVYFILQLFEIIQISKASWITALTYTKYFNYDLDWFTGHAWSLSIEEHFYLFWPLIFIRGDKIRKNFAIALIFVVPIFRVYLRFNNINWTNDFTIFTRIDSIAIGCLFALYKDEILKRIRPHWTKIFLVSSLLLFLLRYIVIGATKIHLGFIFIPLGGTHGTVANILIALIMMYFVFGPQGIWFKILNLKVINYIGLLSYSLYLWQQIYLSGLDYWVMKFPQNIFLLAITAFLSYNLIEMPFLKLKSKFSKIKE